jgi:regulatory protein
MGLMERKITALKAQKRDRSRVSVYLDGEYAFGLPRIVAAWLQVGQVLDDDKIAELKAQDARETAYQRALRLLNYRDRSEAEIVQSLKQKQVPEEIIANVIERLQRSHLVDDQRFAKTWVDNRNEFRPRSRRALAYELREKGIDEQAIEQTLEDFDELEAAYQAASKYTQKIKQLEWQEFRQKLYAFLSRRGFNYDTVKTTVARLRTERDAHSATDDTPLYEEVEP